MNKKALSLILAAAVAVSCMGCTRGETDGGSQPAPSTAEPQYVVRHAAPVYPEAIGYEDYDAQIANDNQNAPLDTTLTAVNDFSLKSAVRVLSGEGNRMYSPLSLYYALSMAAAGAGGETQAQLLSLLGFSRADELLSECGTLFRRIYTDSGVSKLTIANSIWANDKDGFTVRDEYKDALAKSLYASMYSGDFADPALGEAVAAWIRENTNDTLGEAPELTGNELLLLINTVYFYSEWSTRFDENATADDAFTLSDGTTVSASYMNKTSMSGYAKGANFMRISLGLKNGTMTFVLPNEGVDVAELAASPEALREALYGGTEDYAEVTLKLPKFKFGSTFPLADAVKGMGVTEAFGDKADFSGISDSALYISSILQKTHVGIDERGVEAAAYTEIALCGAGMPQTTTELLFTRPFLFSITDSADDILFVGVVENPAA